jgi:signal peptide peptidase SppA
MSDTHAREAMQRMHLREALIAPHYGADAIARDLQLMAKTEAQEAQKTFLEQRRFEICAAFGFNTTKQEKPFAFANGLAIIPITGTLVNRFGASYGFITGYNFIKRQIALAHADPDVIGIVGDINSYGGEAAGCFECAHDVAAMRGEKPMIAVVDSNCYSAGYAIACAFDKIILTPSGGVGSIGCVAMHASFQKMLEIDGIKITFLKFGNHKTDGNPYEDLSQDVKDNLQKGVTAAGNMFIDLVAELRSMDRQVIVDTQAATYRADEALALGLIDAIESPSSAVQAFYDELSGSNSNQPEVDMTQPTKDQSGSEAEAALQAKAAADAKTTLDAATLQAGKDALVRAAAIMNCEEAKGKSKMANHLAFNTLMSLEEAKGMLAVAGVEVAAAADPNAANPFTKAMAETPNPNVGADGTGGADGGDKPNAAQEILNSQKLMHGTPTLALVKKA